MADRLEAIIFNLDNTLLRTDELNAFRQPMGPPLDVQTARRAREVSGVYEAVSEIAQDVPIGVVTNSPRTYTERLLGEYFHDVPWRITTTGPVNRLYKPFGASIKKAVSTLGSDPSRTAYIGANRHDTLAAYQAGVRPVMTLFQHPKLIEAYRAGRKESWPLRPHADPSASNSTTAADDMSITPEAVVWKPEDLVRLAHEPAEFLPVLEAFDALNRIPSPYQWLPLDIEVPVDGERKRLGGIALGRYFGKEKLDASFHQVHSLSQTIASKSHVGMFHAPDHWVDTLAFAIEHMHRVHGIDLITVIPAKPGGDPRMERLLDRVAKRLASLGVAVESNPNVFAMTDVGKTRSKRAADRFDAIQSSLHVAGAAHDQSVLVLDDVVTTGSTLGAAALRLLEHGARNVKLMALARTVSISYWLKEWLDRDCLCEKCGRPLEERTNSKSGQPFLGCSGYPTCNFTKPKPQP